MARGGRRPGAGRKPKAIQRALPPVIAAENKLRDRLPELVDAALELALVDRDPKMLRYCIDRILGTPVDRREQGDVGAFQRGYVIRLVRVGAVDDADDAAAS